MIGSGAKINIISAMTSLLAILGNQKPDFLAVGAYLAV